MRAIICTLACLFFASIVSAQSMPTYSGVFVRTAGGHLVEISRAFSTEIRINMVKEDVNLRHRGNIDTYIRPLNDWRSDQQDLLEFLDEGYNVIARINSYNRDDLPLQSIVIRSRTPELKFVHYLTNFSNFRDHASDYGDGDLLVTKLDQSSISAAMTILDVHWASFNTNFREEIIDQFTSEFTKASGFITGSGFSTAGLSSGGVVPVRAYGIETAEGMFIFY
jgi:hypothetical protein